MEHTWIWMVHWVVWRRHCQHPTLSRLFLYHVHTHRYLDVLLFSISTTCTLFRLLELTLLTFNGRAGSGMEFTFFLGQLPCSKIRAALSCDLLSPEIPCGIDPKLPTVGLSLVLSTCCPSFFILASHSFIRLFSPGILLNKSLFMNPCLDCFTIAMMPHPVQGLEHSQCSVNICW